jgi:hypothetical protein
VYAGVNTEIHVCVRVCRAQQYEMHEVYAGVSIVHTHTYTNICMSSRLYTYTHTLPYLADSLLILRAVALEFVDLIKQRGLSVVESLLILPSVVLGSLHSLVPSLVVFLNA